MQSGVQHHGILSDGFLHRCIRHRCGGGRDDDAGNKVYRCDYRYLYVVRSTTVIYYFKYNLGRTEWLSLVGILGILSGLPMLLALPSLEKRFSKRSLM